MKTIKLSEKEFELLKDLLVSYTGQGDIESESKFQIFLKILDKLESV